MLKPVVLVLLLAAGAAGAGEKTDADMKTVIGPRNPELANGATALLNGRIEEGIRLTRIGLGNANGSRERQAAYSNLCAGYVLLEQYETAIEYCDLALEENDRNWRALNNRALARTELGDYELAKADLDRGEAIAPKASTIKEVRGWLLDHTEPVEPTVTIDDRREEDIDDDADAGTDDAEGAEGDEEV